MCGIAALFNYGKPVPVDPAELRRIRDQMARRGPDGIGEWFDSSGRVGLGHRRLSIIDLRAVADQPMEHADGRYRVIFNGEIYNYRELRAALKQQGHSFRTDSDTEILLHLYQRYGTAMVHRLRGMYAFAIWDQVRGGMLLARDPFGMKPLYYADNGHTIRLASQVKALLQGNDIDRRPEAAGHVGFYVLGNVPDPYTLYRGIRGLPAGTTMWIDAQGRREPRPFFDLRDALRVHPDAPVTPAARRELLRAALIDSIAHHQIADVPVGLFLSAGLDSTTLAALAIENGTTDLNTLTLGFREYAGTRDDETVQAEAFARERHTSHQTRWVTADDFATERVSILAAMDQPTIDGLNVYFVAKAARESGLKVALSGVGGDELFAGYPSYQEVPKLVSALRPFAAWPGLGREFSRLTRGWLGKITSPKYAGLLQYGTHFGGAYMLRRALFMPRELADFLPAELVREGWDELQLLDRMDESILGLQSPRMNVTGLELGWYMRNQLLRDSDWAGMAHSLEIRLPFVDIDLLRKLSPLLNSEYPPSKLDMAHTPATPLPDAILHRPKSGFFVPVHEWLQQDMGSTDRGLRGWAHAVWNAQTNIDLKAAA